MPEIELPAPKDEATPTPAPLGAALSGYLARQAGQWSLDSEAWLVVCMVAMRADCAQEAGERRGEFVFDGRAWYFCAPLARSAQGSELEMVKICVDGIKAMASDKSAQPQVEAASILISIKEAGQKDWRIWSAVATVCPEGHEEMARRIGEQGFSLPAVVGSPSEPVASQYDFRGPIFDMERIRASALWEAQQIGRASQASGLAQAEAVRI